MINLISLEEMQISNLNDIQHGITRIIMNNDRFTQGEIHQQIKEFLIFKGMNPNTVDSIRISDMIDDTIDLLTEKGALYCFNNTYLKNNDYNSKIKIKVKTRSKMRHAKYQK